MRNLLLVLAVGLGLGPLAAEGRIIELPAGKPLMKFQPPKGWSLDPTDHGYTMESPDKEATVVVEMVATPKLPKLLAENKDWLVTDQKVVFDTSSKKEETLTIGETEWKRTTWKVTQADWGPGHVMLGLIQPTEQDSLLVTAWVTTKGEKKYAQPLEDLYGSVMPIGQPTVDIEKSALSSGDKPKTTQSGVISAEGPAKAAPAARAEEPEATGRTRFGGGEPVDPSLLIGMWLGNKYISFYEDGRYGLQKYEGAPMDDKDRTWKLDGNKITWNALGDVFTETIVTLTRAKLVIKDAEGNLQTYKRVGD